MKSDSFKWSFTRKLERTPGDPDTPKHMSLWRATVGFVELQGIKTHLRELIVKMHVDWNCNWKAFGI